MPGCSARPEPQRRAPLHLLLTALLCLALAGCASLPPPPARAPSTVMQGGEATRLGRLAAAQTATHPGLSGLLAFEDPHDALAARLLLARAAEQSIDAQYFIWNGDTVGLLLWQALWDAAERGVRVRLLVDDANTSGLDPLLAALDAHPMLELRLYNPFVQRGSRATGYLSDFRRLNRRMHNKSFTVDAVASVVGGRNIADAYFGADESLGFADLDVLAIGPVVQQVGEEFDLYWNSASAYPAALFVGPPPADPAAVLRPHFAALHQDPKAQAYLAAVEQSDLVNQLRQQQLVLDWATAQVLYDQPGKTLDAAARSELQMLPLLMQRMGTPKRQLDIVSPYFVPGAEGTALLVDLAQRGVQVRVLTNSLASSDESVVHAGYMKRRQDLLRAGVQLYELKPTAADSSLRVRGRFGPAKVSGLHAKTYGVDGERTFVGSFNFDQRSANLNTEMGLVIDSPQAAAHLDSIFDETVPEVAYEVKLASDGQNLQWVERSETGAVTVYDVDPQTTFWKRLSVGFLAGLPIEWLL
jgi:putative cardiolipin synthase